MNSAISASTDQADPLSRAKEFFQLGLQAHTQGDFSSAERHFRAALDLAPGRPSLLVNLGAALIALGEIDEAKETLNQVLDQDPENATAHLNLGICHCDLSEWQQALRSLGQAVRLDPDNAQAKTMLETAAEARYQQGLDLYLAKDAPRARDILEEVAATAPDHYGAAVLLGTMAQLERRREDAMAWLSRAVALNDSDAAVHGILGSLLIELGQLPEALICLERSLALDATLAEVHYNRGWVLQCQGKLEDAIQCYDLALALDPTMNEGLNAKGTALQALYRYDEALACFDSAIGNQHPIPAPATNDVSRVDASKTQQGAAEEAAPPDGAGLRPTADTLWYNRGVLLGEVGQLDAAISSYQQAIASNPRNAGAHWNLSLALLLQGRFTEGWPLHEWRWTPEFQGQPRTFSKPLWLGQGSLAGKTILVHVEQGYGDTLQMCRFSPRLSARGARVVFEVQPALYRLLSGLEGVEQVVAFGEQLPAFDVHCPFMSLPLALQIDEESLGDGSAYLNCPKGVRETWARLLGPRTRPRIGIAWSGSATHKNDANRSIRIEDVMAHLPRSVEWISLQKDVRESDREAVSSGLIRHFGEHLHDFTDTAALCTLVDQVVTVDTSAAHLAGALGCPTTVLLPFIPDWRWLLDREDSPWYASVRLLRQGPDREWGPVLRRLAERLASE